MNAKKANRRSLRQRYIVAQTKLFIRGGFTPKARFYARKEADKICKVMKE